MNPITNPKPTYSLLYHMTTGVRSSTIHIFYVMNTYSTQWDISEEVHRFYFNVKQGSYLTNITPK
jgi:hypothetical protein